MRSLKKQVDINITFDDILDGIRTCDEYECDQIRNIIGNDYDVSWRDVLTEIECASYYQIEEIKKMLHIDEDIFKAENLYDELKVRLLKEAYNKYNLEELTDKLKINNY